MARSGFVRPANEVRGYCHRPQWFDSAGLELPRYALGDNKSDIVVLFAGAELANLVHDRCQQILRRQFTMPAQSFSQALFSKFFSRPS